MRNSTEPGPRPAASLMKYGSTPSSSVYQRVAAGRSSAHRFTVLLPRSRVTSFTGVGLFFSSAAVADVPDVAIRVGEGSAVPAPLQLRRGLEDLPAGLLGLVQNFVDGILAAHDAREDNAAEAAAVRTHAHHVGEPVAAVGAAGGGPGGVGWGAGPSARGGGGVAAPD